MNEILMRVVVEAAAFLELAADDVLDPDVAVKQLESMAYLLGQLNESEKRQLVAFTQAEASILTRLRRFEPALLYRCIGGRGGKPLDERLGGFRLF